MHTGSCLCGSVRYEIRGDIGPGFYCHCTRCRKASGTAFASNALVAADDFVITAGREALKTFIAESGLHRSFCGNCGSPIISQRAGVPQVRVRLGTLDTPLGHGPQAHIYVDSKAEWWDIHDDLTQYPEAPPRPGK
ncbi:GFA family protein [Lysobacter yangpyeongensis]|uniref:GFA family protein n=1 Tax=Lysobacter yangpyeongensis TaxID=346182 RepID=A0ABW0SKX9_9GAMM